MSGTFYAEGPGPHLLGRKPMPPDERDYRAADYLSDLDKQLALVLADKSVAAGTKRMFRAVVKAIEPGPPAPTPDPAPTPPPPAPTPTPSGGVRWSDTETTLDQGQTPHCVGFGWAQWGNTLPVDDRYGNTDGDAIYYECKVIDGEPKAEDGSDTRSGVKAMKNRGRVSVYAFAATIAEVKTWILTRGPVVVGTDWENDMFSPAVDGRLSISGGVAGGHEYLLDEYDPDTNRLWLHNSWGASWGVQGRAYMDADEWAAKLLQGGGDACVVVELP